jgi:hypothetical protein
VKTASTTLVLLPWWSDGVLVSICANVYIYSADEFVRRCIIYIYIIYYTGSDEFVR